MRMAAERRRFALRSTLMLVITTALAVSSFGQDRPQWRTARDITAGRNGTLVGTVETVDEYRLTFTVRLDDVASSVVRVTTDAGSTSFRSFGDGTSSDVIRGERGFGRLRRGDRVQVAGVGGSSGSVAASEVRLLGRTSARAPTTRPTTGEFEGTVRSVNPTESSIVVETSDRQLITVRGATDTPVYFRGNTYRIRNLEAGDVVRVTPARTVNNDVHARSIDVIRSISDVDTPNDRTVGALRGRVTRVDSRAETFRLDPENGRELRIDAADALDERGRSLRVSDLNVGDYVEVTGRYDTVGNFRADRVRRTTGRDDGVDRTPPRRDDDDDDDEVFDRDDDDDDDEELEERFEDALDEFATVTLTGRIIESLSSSDYLTVRDENSNRDVLVLVDDELVVRNRAGSYITASQLRIGERISMRAMRHESGVYIAQTIRVR